jgi:hypothetical protein
MNYNNFKPGVNPPTIITAQQYGTKVSVELDHSDTDIDELFDAFETICIGLGYHQNAWKQWIVDRAGEYHDEETETLKSKLNEWKFDDEQIDAAIAQHNAHEEGFDIEDQFDDYGMRTHNHD